MLVTGPNGAGKTNLLEALHVGTQGFSPRTRADAQLIRFGEQAARVRLRGRRGNVNTELDVLLRVGEGKQAHLNGARLTAAEQHERVLPCADERESELCDLLGPGRERVTVGEARGDAAEGRVPLAHGGAVFGRQ